MKHALIFMTTIFLAAPSFAACGRYFSSFELAKTEVDQIQRQLLNDSSSKRISDGINLSLPSVSIRALIRVPQGYGSRDACETGSDRFYIEIDGQIQDRGNVRNDVG